MNSIARWWTVAGCGYTLSMRITVPPAAAMPDRS